MVWAMVRLGCLANCGSEPILKMSTRRHKYRVWRIVVFPGKQREGWAEREMLIRISMRGESAAFGFYIRGALASARLSLVHQTSSRFRRPKWSDHVTAQSRNCALFLPPTIYNVAGAVGSSPPQAWKTCRLPSIFLCSISKDVSLAILVRSCLSHATLFCCIVA